MTMALVKDGRVTKLGLPDKLRNYSLSELRNMGWHKVVGAPIPKAPAKPGYQWQYGAKWSVENNAVHGTWTQKKQPQPYPSWSWVNGEGWVPPTPKPEGEHNWNEKSQTWHPAEIED